MRRRSFLKGLVLGPVAGGLLLAKLAEARPKVAAGAVYESDFGRVLIRDPRWVYPCAGCEHQDWRKPAALWGKTEPGRCLCEQWAACANGFGRRVEARVFDSMRT